MRALTHPTPARGVAGHPLARSVGIGRAHAKAIVLGEHAVVYGAPALVLPVPQLTVTATAGWCAHDDRGGGEVSFTMTGSPSRPVITQAFDGLARLTAHFTAAAGISDVPHLDVVIDGGIPHGRGLGSSAAYARAVVLALSDLFDHPLTAHQVFDLVQSAENIAHGRSSGVDATAVGAGGPLYYRAGTATPADVGCQGLFVIADSGQAGSTKDAVNLLRNRFAARPGSRETFVGSATQLTDRARRALAAGDDEDLGACLTGCHDLLREAGVSTPGIDALVAAARQAGSLGAKITGGGLGGCMIALTHPDTAGPVTRSLHQAGAVQTWVVPLRGFPRHGH
jgi:mevalonate kinase